MKVFFLKLILLTAFSLIAACALKEQERVYPKGGVYIVKPGDTTLLVAKKLNVPEEELIAENQLPYPYDISSGDELLVPYDVAKPPSANNIPTVTAVPTAPVEIEDNEVKQNKVIYKVVDKSETLAPKPKKKVELKPQQFIWPLKGKLVDKFGPLEGGMFNNGITIKGKQAEEVKAIANGEVVYIGEAKEYGNLVLLRHYGGWFSAYSYKNIAEGLQKGDFVAQGDVIGTIGATDENKKPLLHLVLKKKKKMVDPLHYLPKPTSGN